MTLRDLINKLLGRETSSANTARERLQLVLAHDRVDMSSLTTDLLDKMRKEILDVVAKYVEIDFEEVATSSKSISTYFATTSRISFLILSKRSVVKELISTLSWASTSCNLSLAVFALDVSLPSNLFIRSLRVIILKNLCLH